MLPVGAKTVAVEGPSGTLWMKEYVRSYVCVFYPIVLMLLFSLVRVAIARYLRTFTPSFVSSVDPIESRRLFR